jgi:outer membrane protein, heavy metal efflux system
MHGFFNTEISCSLQVNKGFMSRFLRPGFRHKTALFALALSTAIPVKIAYAQAPFETSNIKVSQLIEMAKQSNLQIEGARQDVLASDAGLITARAFPNPELELIPGLANARTGNSGTSAAFGIVQPIERPSFRRAKQDLASSRIALAQSNQKVVEAFVIDQVRRRSVETVKAQEELAAVTEDLQIAKQIAERVRVRARTGEAPRFDLMRAEAEVAIVQKNFESAQSKVKQTKIELQQAIGRSLPVSFNVEVDASLNALLAESDYQLLRVTVAELNPELAAARRETDKNVMLTELERRSVLPQFSIRAQHEREPDISFNRIGVQMSIPFFNKREGPIAEAQALTKRSQVLAQARQYELENSFDAAWAAYISAQQQVKAFEEGILQRSRAVLEVAEAAYRLGERGILEYLDAQRQFRLIRNDLVVARYNLLVTRTQLERLAGR